MAKTKGKPNNGGEPAPTPKPQATATPTKGKVFLGVTMLLLGAAIVIWIFAVLFDTGVLGNGDDKIVYITATTPAPNVGTTSGNTAVTTANNCPGDHEVKTGETYQVPAGCNVKGDVSANGKQLYDGDPATGLIVSCVQACTITAPWGANVSPRTVDDLKNEMLSTGCGSSCADVKVVVIDGKSTNVQVTDLCDVSLPKGTTATVPGGCVVSGDVAVNGKALYDSDQTTGLVVIVQSEVEVFAPFGASVTNASVDDVVNAVKQTGCGLPEGCRVVNTVTVP